MYLQNGNYQDVYHLLFYPLFQDTYPDLKDRAEYAKNWLEENTELRFTEWAHE